MSERKVNGLLFACFFIATLLLYLPSLGGGPLVDDYRILASSKWDGWFGNFSAPNPKVGGVFWRPAVSVFLRIQWLLFHVHFSGYHVMSALLCAITALAIYAVLFKLTKNRWIGIVSAAFFIAWPSHPETMIWIAGQTDGLGTCFALLALWGFVSYWTEARPEPIRALLWLIPLILALLSKETEIVMPVMILIFGLVIRPRTMKEDKWRLAFLAGNAILMTLAYLWIRSIMLHVPLAGGGYETAVRRHGLATAIYNGFMDYHIDLGLLNAFAPLSSRIAPFLGWSSDGLVLIVLTFGIAAVVRFLPRSPRSALNRWIPLGIVLFLLLNAFQLSDNYDLAIVASLFKTPATLACLALLIAVIVAWILRRPREIRTASNQISSWSINAPYVYLAASVVAAYVVYRYLSQGVAHQMPYPAIFGFWLLAYLTRNPRAKKTGDPQALTPAVALLMAAATIIALVPVITVGVVDDNLANARFAHLASAFAVPAIVAGLWTILRDQRARQFSSLAISCVLVAAVVPVIQVWAHCGRLANIFDDVVQDSRASKIYVLASPGFIPSATTVMLGGSELDAAGRLLRDDGLQVLPGYFADGFTNGDHVYVQPLGPSTWRVGLTPGYCSYRSGRLSVAPCYEQRYMPRAYALVSGAHSSGERIIRINDPEGEVIAVDEDEVLVLRADPAQPSPSYSRSGPTLALVAAQL